MSRKAWIGIVGVLLLAVAVGVWWLQQPAKGSIEYHLARARETAHLAYLMQARPREPRVRLRRLFHPNRTARDYSKEHNRHLQALIDLGYLERRAFVFSNQVVVTGKSLTRFWRAMRSFPAFNDNDRAFVINAETRSNALVITARPEQMPAWEQFVKEYDPTLAAEATAADE